MNFVEGLLLFFFAGTLYFILFHSFVKSIYHGFRKDRFKCTRCGECCKFLVKVYPEDVKRLELAGKKGFYETRGKFKLIKRTLDRYCVFYERNNKTGVGKCTAYNARPRICRSYPFHRFWGLPQADPRCPFLEKK